MQTDARPVVANQLNTRHGAYVDIETVVVSNAAYNPVNGDYTKSGSIWKNQNGIQLDVGGFGVGQQSFCPDNTKVWWMRENGEPLYFSCDFSDPEVPATSGWQARKSPYHPWS